MLRDRTRVPEQVPLTAGQRPPPSRYGARMAGRGDHFETILYGVEAGVATITLNRPERLNTIVPPMPDEVEAAVGLAVRDAEVKVIVVRGAGRSFCAGYDFGEGFHHWDEWITSDGRWDPGKDFALATAPEIAPTQKFMSVWRAPKPVIAQVHGWCVGGGSDFALCADLVIASEDAVIGTPYSRMWGAYLSGMWIYRLGLAKAKEHALTGKPLTGSEAADVGPDQPGGPVRRARGHGGRAGGRARLDPRVAARGAEARGQPGLREHGARGHADARPDPGRPHAQHPRRASASSGSSRSEGMGAAVAERDGPFGDYSQAPPERRPDPRNVIDP